jgi:hypothetical protein
MIKSYIVFNLSAWYSRFIWSTDRIWQYISNNISGETLRILIFIVGGFMIVYLGSSTRVSGQIASSYEAASTVISIQNRQVFVNGAPFLIRGVGYAPSPIGQDPETMSPNGDYFTPDYSAIFNRDLPFLRGMGANTVRLWGWKYNADHTAFLDAAYNQGSRPIYVIISYWVNASLDLTNSTIRKQIINEFTQMVALHKNHPAVLMWMIGNELNAPWMYGNSDDLFSLINEMALAAHIEEGIHSHPVTTPLADINLINTFQQRDAQMTNLDVWSVQLYRGSSFGSFFNDYLTASTKPFVITEFGIDAFDDIHGDEYEKIGPPYQALYAQSLWKEIEEHSSVCSGGSIMAYTDEWWKGKHGQNDVGHLNCPETDPSFHSTCGYSSASHPDGYANEEWWGVMRTVKNGNISDSLQPRAVYYALQSIWVKKVYIPFLKN